MHRNTRLVRLLFLVGFAFIIVGYLYLGVGLQCVHADDAGLPDYTIPNCGLPFSTIVLGAYGNGYPPMITPYTASWVIPFPFSDGGMGLIVNPLILNTLCWVALLIVWCWLYRWYDAK